MAWRVCVVVLFMIISLVSCQDNSFNTRWETFKANNNREYKNGDVEFYRRAIWEETVMGIEQHNREADQGVHSYWMKETPWDDMTFDEFFHHGDGFDPNDFHRSKRANRNGTGDCFNDQVWNDTSPYPFNKTATLPRNVDWTQKGYVTSVKNQASCGSCWAFSTVGAIEGQIFKRYKRLTSLSPQNLVDCSTKNNGCGGGLPSRAFSYVISNGIASNANYPYTAKKGRCKSFTVSANITGYKTINSDEELINAVAYIGPVSVGIKTGPKIRNYAHGVFSGCSGAINHAVLVVGYGYYNNTKVWKIKNSWSASWGNKGYFYMTRQVNNACGIGQYASYPLLTGVKRGPINGGQVPSLTTTTGAGVSGRLSMQAFSLSLILILIAFRHW